MMRLLRWAYAVASAGTRATAPPRTRSCVTAIAALEASIRSRIVSAVAVSMAPTKPVRKAATGR